MNKDTPIAIGGVLLILVVAIAAGGLSKEVTKEVLNSAKEDRGISNDVLKEAASEINAQLPSMIDSETRLDSSFGFNNKFTYSYTLINYQREDLTIELFRQELLPTINRQVLKKIYISVEKTRKYFLWALITSFVVFILPLLVLLFIIPKFLSIYTSALGGF